MPAPVGHLRGGHLRGCRAYRAPDPSARQPASTFFGAPHSTDKPSLVPSSLSAAHAQAHVLEHVFRCFVGARMEGVTREELLHVLAALGLHTSEEEVDVLIAEHCGDDSANAMLTTHEFVAIARAYLKGSSASTAAAASSSSGEASAVVDPADASFDGDEGFALGSHDGQQSRVQCETGEMTAEGARACCVA